MLLLPLIGGCAYAPQSPVVRVPPAAAVDSAASVVSSATIVGSSAVAPEVEVTNFAERLVVLRDGTGRRVRPDDVARYRCEVGRLICTSESGRVATRYCECL